VQSQVSKEKKEKKNHTNHTFSREVNVKGRRNGILYGVNWLPSEAGESPSLEMLRTQVDAVLSNLL